jgi:hypothetical protein
MSSENETETVFCEYCGLSFNESSSRTDNLIAKENHANIVHEKILQALSKVSDTFDKESLKSEETKTPYEEFLESTEKEILAKATLESDEHLLRELRKNPSMLERLAKDKLLLRAMKESKFDSLRGMQDKFRDIEISRIQNSLNAGNCPLGCSSPYTDVLKDSSGVTIVQKRLSALEHLKECAKTDKRHAESLAYFERLLQWKANPKGIEEYYSEKDKKPKDITKMSMENLSESERRERTKSLVILSALLKDKKENKETEE